jgi:glycosyltransferase involved in cell wall biosynthesis
MIKVSVIIPVYNEEKYIEKTLVAVLDFIKIDLTIILFLLTMVLQIKQERF